jgi:flavorubredoxin
MHRFPREIAPGVLWIASCEVEAEQGVESHGHFAAFLVHGAERCALVDTGHPRDWPVLEAQLEEALAGRSLDYVFPTHLELPHYGNLQRLMAKFPGCVAAGAVRGLHLYYPELAGRARPSRVGDGLDLGGGRGLRVVEAVLRDLPDTLWAVEPASGVLFVSDGLAHFHHVPGECALTTEELAEPPAPENYARLRDQAFYWMRYADVEGCVDEVEALLSRCGARVLAPAHGCVVTRPAAVLPALRAGLVAGL